jgi:hypothetical protein
VSAEGEVGPLIPVIDVALLHADMTNKNGSEERRSISRTSGMGFPCCDCTKVKCKNRRWLQSSATSADPVGPSTQSRAGDDYCTPPLGWNP